ncbi:MAG: addiction module protein [Steroidobacteraceae bacterium]
MKKKLQQLTVDERIRLVEDLWDSIAADQGALPITADQRLELDRRLNAYAFDKNRGQPAADAVRDVRRQL